MNLLLLYPSEALGDGQYRVSGPRLDHLNHVLKVSPGDNLSVGLINGKKGTGRITEIDASGAVITVESLEQAGVPTVAVDLICAIPRPKILKKVLFVTGMFGLRNVHFVRANRTDKSYLQSPLLQDESSQAYLVAGIAQGEWTRLPVVHLHPLFRPFLEDSLPTLPGFALAPKLLPDLVGGGSLDRLLRGGKPEQVILAIGPEGGWVDFERDLFAAKGFRQYSLGQANLRVEFALAAALAQINLLAE